MDTSFESVVVAPSAPSAVSMADSLSARIRLVATTCCVCATPLADETSVELGIGPTCRKRIAKLDTTAAASPDWDAVSDALGSFAAVDRSDEDRLALFEMAMGQIVLARKGVAHKLANLITHYIAATQDRGPSIGDLILAIERMGRPNLAAALRKRQYPVRIEVEGDALHVFTPFEESFKNAMWQRSLGRWNRDLKCYVVPSSRRADLYSVLVNSYAGMRAISPEGDFKLDRVPPPAFAANSKETTTTTTPVKAAAPAFAGRKGDVGYIQAGPHIGKSGVVFWESPDKHRLGIRSCTCNRRCGHEPLWCDARHVSTIAPSAAAAAA
jgi:hypothetical protein